MGKLKQQALKQEEEGVEATLLEHEFAYLSGLNWSRNNIINELNRMMSAYMYQIAVSRLGYEKDKNLKFEIDFDNPDGRIKIWEVDDSLFNPSVDNK